MIMEGIDLIYRINDSIERTAVSGKTNYLVAGFEMDDGRAITEGAKYKEAKKKKVKIGYMIIFLVKFHPLNFEIQSKITLTKIADHLLMFKKIHFSKVLCLMNLLNLLIIYLIKF